MLPPKLVFVLFTLSLVLAAILPACQSTNPDGTPTTQPSVSANTVISLLIADYDLAVSQGWVKETPALDGAIKAYFQATSDLSAGKGTIVAVNDALLTLTETVVKKK